MRALPAYMVKAFRIALCGWLLTIATSLCAENESQIDFSYQIRPILAKNCFACHGPDEGHRAADLRLDDRDSAVTELEVIVPGEPEESTIVDKITAEDEDERMPPAESGNQLSAVEVELIRRWIKQGAPYAKHWSYELPQSWPLPEVSDADWPRNEIDHFVLARLEQEGLRPQAEADRYTLLRRLSLDLTGVPPTLAAIQAFMDDTSNDAYEKVVDRLLASPAYGERWARKWLDLARYADTKGYEKDDRRSIWMFRDWVIKAINADMPFDQFTIEQIAGDLLPDATHEQRVATAFHRNTMNNTEGGSDDEEFRVLAVVDRVNTTMQVWMGTTMGCAQCHTHKFDPITQTEYYQFFALFNQTEDSDKNDNRPTMPTPTEAQRKRQAAIEKQLHDVQQQIETEIAKYDGQQLAGQAEWEQAEKAKDEKAERRLDPELRKILDVSPSDRSVADQKDIRAAYIEWGLPEARNAFDPLIARRTELVKQQTELKSQITTTPIMRELAPDKQRKTHIHVRGNFLDKGEEVTGNTPAAFGLLPDEAEHDRLAVAHWLIDRDNPLTSRVAVNRHWEHMFGTGLVETSEDFGSQGTLPSHPKLLDWLAVRFMDDGWSMKRLCRLIVTSATYRQSSQQTAELTERDPRNRLLARGPRFRLPAEMVRDQALAASGLLSRKMYGPSVMPPQPEGVWQTVYSNDKWVTSEGEDKYRRGLYTFWRRTNPYPSMITMDATSREVCTVRRVRTNTPLAALVTMNDPVYVEAAQALAWRMIEAGGQDVRAAIDHGLRRVLNRPAQPRELERLARLFESELAHYQQRTEEAQQMAASYIDAPQGADFSRLAAWTVVANVMLNLDEALTKE